MILRYILTIIIVLFHSNSHSDPFTNEIGIIKEPEVVEIKIEESSDPRSYHINSDKIKKLLNFEFKYKVNDAINDLLNEFDKGNLKDSFEEKWSNISTLKKNKNFLESFDLN